MNRNNREEKIMQKNEYEIIVTKDGVTSNESGFVNSYDFLNGNKELRPKILGFYYSKDDKRIERNPSKGEKKLAATSIIRLGIQVFETNLLMLDDVGLKAIKTDGYDKLGTIGFYRNKEKFENDFGNTKLKGTGKPMFRTDFISPYKDAGGNEVLYFYNCGLHDSIIGVMHLLKRFDDNGKFVIKYLRPTPTLQEKREENKDEVKISKTNKNPRNMIYFGAPGVGKSYNMNILADKYFEGRYDRVTFYSDYSYAQFVGTYKPVVTKSSQVIAPLGLNISESELALFNEIDGKQYDEIDFSQIDKSVDKAAKAGLLAFLFPDKTDTWDKAGLTSYASSIQSAARPIRKYVEWKELTVEKSSDITYAFIPGPFTETLVKALKNPDSDYLLIIEEINRADAAGVFGDAFQLLDRQHNGESEYAITPSKDLAEYLDGEVPNWRNKWSGKLKIPSNMFIWATMNSADQGVFPLDTAFKRRWAFEYIPIDNAEDEVNKTWNNWRKDINKKLQELEIEEDKFLGAHFISRNIVGNCDRDITQDDAFKREFKNKVLMYLFEDAGKYHREDIFGDSKITLSEVFERFDNWDFNADGNILDALGSSNNVKSVEEPREDNNSHD